MTPDHYDPPAYVQAFDEQECDMYTWRTSTEGLIVVQTDGGPEWIPTLQGGNADGMASVLARWGDMSRSVSDRWGLPETWLPSMIWRESGGNPSAVNQEGHPEDWMRWGVGLVQITAPGLKAGLTLDALRDPQTNLEVGARFIARQLVPRYGQDFPRISAAYNAGSVRESKLNQWGMLCTGSHVDAEVAAVNWQILQQQAVAQSVAAAQFDLVANLDLLRPTGRDRDG